jgi:hypothetical protein
MPIGRKGRASSEDPWALPLVRQETPDWRLWSALVERALIPNHKRLTLLKGFYGAPSKVGENESAADRRALEQE